MKIADFGVSKLHGENSRLKSVVGTVCDIPPEVEQKNGYTTSVDCFSLGGILFSGCVQVLLICIVLILTLDRAD